MSDPSTNDLGDPNTTPLRDLTFGRLWDCYRDWPLGHDGCKATAGISHIWFHGPDGRYMRLSCDGGHWFMLRSDEPAAAHISTIADLDVHLRWVAGEAE